MRHLFTISRIAAAAWLAGLLPADSALAAWPHASHANLAISTAANNQSQIGIIPDGSGGVIVTWQDLRGAGSDIYAQRVSAAGVPLWTAGGAAVVTAAGDQLAPVIVPDGMGGALVAWVDNRSGNSDIYAQRMTASGAIGWIANGHPLCTASGNQTAPQICSDGAGGAIVAWTDGRVAASDIYAQRVDPFGARLWTTNGVPLCAATGAQLSPAIVADGGGGAIIAWTDFRGADADIYARRVDSAGTPQWTSDGVVLAVVTGTQDQPAIATDDVGGAIIAWRDFRSGGTSDVYAGRVNSSGASVLGSGIPLCTATGDQNEIVIAPDAAGGIVSAWNDARGGTLDIYAARMGGDGARPWPTNGIAVCSAASTQQTPAVTGDGAGGFIASWSDLRSTAFDVYAQYITGSGSPAWTTNGIAVSTAIGGQLAARLAPDGSGGAVAAWEDSRSGGFSDVYAQRVERFGVLGNPEPVIADVRDVPGDQGGRVRVEWSASYLDAFPGLDVTEYSVWRRAPAGTSAKRGALPEMHDHLASLVTRGARERPVRATIENGLTTYWEFIESLPARALPGYSYSAPTTVDSIAGSNPLTSYMVLAERAGGSAFWASAPDSGYSVDDLAPAPPAPFTGSYDSGIVQLHWHPNDEADLAGYRLYRGTETDFVPSPGNLVAALPDTGHTDAAGAPYVYKLTAVDVHGNESSPTTLVPSGTTAVESARGASLSFALPAPNPMRASGGTFRFGVPSRGPLRLALHDVHGRRVRTLAHGIHDAGVHELRFDGRDRSGRLLQPGVYLAVLVAAGREMMQRVVIVGD